MQCDRCTGEQFTKAGRDRQGRQLYRCTGCGRRMTVRSRSAFSGYRFPDEVIALAVRWYLRYRLSYADVAEWLAERGITVDPSTIYDWVRAFTPRFIEAARTHRAPVGSRWRVDETYLKIGGRQRYLFRAIDEHGQIIDVYLSDRRNADAARTFFKEAIQGSSVTPTRVTTGYPLGEGEMLSTRAPHRAPLGRTSILQILKQRPGTGPSAFERTSAADAPVQNRQWSVYLLSGPRYDPGSRTRILIARDRGCTACAVSYGVVSPCRDPVSPLERFRQLAFRFAILARNSSTQPNETSCRASCTWSTPRPMPRTPIE
jgi:transposase-like protein